MCLPEVRVVLALGAIAWRACVDHFRRFGRSGWQSEAAAVRSRRRRSIPEGGEGAGARANRRRTLMGSFHVSQQNTQTGKLTAAMFDAVLASAKRYAAR